MNTINPIPQARVPVQAGDDTPLGALLYSRVASTDYSNRYRQGPPTGGRATHRGVRLEVERGEAVHHVKKPRIISAPFLGNRRPDTTSPIDNNNSSHRCSFSDNNSVSVRVASDDCLSRSNLCALFRRNNSRLQSVGLAIPGRGWFLSVMVECILSITNKKITTNTLVQYIRTILAHPLGSLDSLQK